MKLKAFKSVLIWMIACSPLAIFLACLVSNASYAEDFDLRNSKTIQNLTIAADEGDEVAAYRLGHYFESNHDIVNAVYWYKESAYGGYDMALNRIGEFHLVGEGELVKKDIRLAIKYLETAADQGDPTLQLSLADLYQYGKHGFPVSESKAKIWYARAAVQERLM